MEPNPTNQQNQKIAYHEAFPFSANAATYRAFYDSLLTKEIEETKTNGDVSSTLELFLVF
mgnify:CR=1 FL=1